MAQGERAYEIILKAKPLIVRLRRTQIKKVLNAKTSVHDIIQFGWLSVKQVKPTKILCCNIYSIACLAAELTFACRPMAMRITRSCKYGANQLQASYVLSQQRLWPACRMMKTDEAQSSPSSVNSRQSWLWEIY